MFSKTFVKNFWQKTCFSFIDALSLHHLSNHVLKEKRGRYYCRSLLFIYTLYSLRSFSLRALYVTKYAVHGKM